MYTDKRKSPWKLLLAIVMTIVVIVFAVVKMNPSREIDEEGAAAIKDAVMRSALQCYVVEGAYPSDLAYLQDNYGLQINTEDFYVTYDIFAQNLPPTVRVNLKNK